MPVRRTSDLTFNSRDSSGSGNPPNGFSATITGPTRVRGRKIEAQIISSPILEKIDGEDYVEIELSNGQFRLDDVGAGPDRGTSFLLTQMEDPSSIKVEIIAGPHTGESYLFNKEKQQTDVEVVSGPNAGLVGKFPEKASIPGCISQLQSSQSVITTTKKPTKSPVITTSPAYYEAEPDDPASTINDSVVGPTKKFFEVTEAFLKKIGISEVEIGLSRLIKRLGTASTFLNFVGIGNKHTENGELSVEGGIETVLEFGARKITSTGITSGVLTVGALICGKPGPILALAMKESADIASDEVYERFLKDSVDQFGKDCAKCVVEIPATLLEDAQRDERLMRAFVENIKEKVQSLFPKGTPVNSVVPIEFDLTTGTGLSIQMERCNPPELKKAIVEVNSSLLKTIGFRQNGSELNDFIQNLKSGSAFLGCVQDEEGTISIDNGLESVLDFGAREAASGGVDFKVLTVGALVRGKSGSTLVLAFKNSNFPSDESFEQFMQDNLNQFGRGLPKYVVKIPAAQLRKVTSDRRLVAAFVENIKEQIGRLPSTDSNYMPIEFDLTPEPDLTVDLARYVGCDPSLEEERIGAPDAKRRRAYLKRYAEEGLSVEEEPCHFSHMAKVEMPLVSGFSHLAHDLVHEGEDVLNEAETYERRADARSKFLRENPLSGDAEKEWARAEKRELMLGKLEAKVVKMAAKAKIKAGRILNRGSQALEGEVLALPDSLGSAFGSNAAGAVLHPERYDSFEDGVADVAQKTLLQVRDQVATDVAFTMGKSAVGELCGKSVADKIPGLGTMMTAYEVGNTMLHAKNFGDGVGEVSKFGIKSGFTSAGTALGTAAIPIPFVGSAVGAFAGKFIGEAQSARVDRFRDDFAKDGLRGAFEGQIERTADDISAGTRLGRTIAPDSGEVAFLGGAVGALIEEENCKKLETVAHNAMDGAELAREVMPIDGVNTVVGGIGGAIFGHEEIERASRLLAPFKPLVRLFRKITHS